MKNLLLLSLLVISTSCEYATSKYGYYWNPLKVLELANKSLKSGDLVAFSEYLSGKAQTEYASYEGMGRLSDALKNTKGALKEPKLISQGPLKDTVYVGYAAHYKKVYLADISPLKITITCYFGDTKSSCSISDIKNLMVP